VGSNDSSPNRLKQNGGNPLRVEWLSLPGSGVLAILCMRQPIGVRGSTDVCRTFPVLKHASGNNPQKLSGINSVGRINT
jgi:hypothetical protein